MIKQLFFSITLINLSTNIFCMQAALQRMRLALPSAICLARMPKPHLMPQRNLIYKMYGETYGSKSSPSSSAILNRLTSYSIQFPAHKFQRALNISTKGKLQFVKIHKTSAGKDVEDQYFAFETSQDAQNIANGAFKINGSMGIIAHNKKTGCPLLWNEKLPDLKFLKTVPHENSLDIRLLELQDGRLVYRDFSPPSDITLNKDHTLQWFYYKEMTPAKLTALQLWHQRKELYEALTAKRN